MIALEMRNLAGGEVLHAYPQGSIFGHCCFRHILLLMGNLPVALR